MDTHLDAKIFFRKKIHTKDEDGKLVKTATYDELLERVKRPTVQGGDHRGQLFLLELRVGVNWSQAPKQRIWGFVLPFKAEFIVGTSIWDDLNLGAPPFHWDVAFCGVFLDHSIQAWWLRCSWKVKFRSFVPGDCFLAKFLDKLHISCKFFRRICRDHGHSPGACCNLFLCNIPDEFLQLQETFELFAEIFSFPARWWKVKINVIRTP